MKISKTKIAVLALGMSALLQSSAFAQGGSSGVGGGGSGVILANDTVVLADPFVARVQQTSTKFRFDLAPEILQEVGIAVYAMAAYGGKPYPKIANGFIWELVSGRGIEYYAVDEIPRNCPYQSPVVTNLPEGSRVAVVACTFENKTYIVKSIFEKMSIREQSKLIIHEALRRLRSISTDESSDQLIAKVTNGVDLIFQLNQNERQGIQNELTDAQIETLTQMATITWQKDLLNTAFLTGYQSVSGIKMPLAPPVEGQLFSITLNNYRIRKRGGGLVHFNAKIDPTAYTGVGQVFGKDTRMDKGSSILQSATRVCLNACELGENALIRQVHVSKSNSLEVPKKLDENVEGYLPAFYLKANAQLDQVSLRGISAVSLGEGSSITQSDLLQSSAKFLDRAPSILLTHQASLKNLHSLYLKSGANASGILLHTAIPLDGIFEDHTTWTLSGIQVDGTQASPCQSGRYYFFARGKHIKVSNVAELESVCMSSRKIK